MSGKKTIFGSGLEIVLSKGQLGQLEYAHYQNANAGPHVYRITKIKHKTNSNNRFHFVFNFKHTM